jgi:hypothetical protein
VAHIARWLNTSPQSLRAWVEERPRWLHAPLMGVFLVYGFVLLRGGLVVLPIVLLVYFFGSSSTRATLGPTLLAVLIYVPAAGFLGGLLVSALRPILRHFGVVGRYLQFIVGTWGYCVVLVFAIMPALDPQDRFQWSEPSGWIISGLMGVFFGLGGAHTWYEKANSPGDSSGARREGAA